MADDQQTNLRNRIAAKRAEPAFQAFAKAMEAPVNLDAACAVFYREAADICDEAGGKYAGRALNEHAAGAFDLMETFLRKANEAEYVATPCDPMVPCEDGGEPCHVHERLMAHAEGDHELCEPDCGPAVPVSSPPPDQTAVALAVLADDLRYVLNYRGPGHAHEKSGVWDTSGKPCSHCARLAAAREHLAAYEADPAAVLPADRTAMNAAQSLLLRAADLVAERASDLWAPDSKAHAEMLGDAAQLRRLAAEAQQPDTETRACVHPDGCDRECPCPPSCGCCTVTAAQQPEAEPTSEQIVRDHVTTLHLIGEQLANVETWMWEHLADVRAASAAADPAQEPGRV